MDTEKIMCPSNGPFVIIFCFRGIYISTYINNIACLPFGRNGCAGSSKPSTLCEELPVKQRMGRTATYGEWDAEKLREAREVAPRETLSITIRDRELSQWGDYIKYDENVKFPKLCEAIGQTSNS